MAASSGLLSKLRVVPLGGGGGGGLKLCMLALSSEQYSENLQAKKKPSRKQTCGAIFLHSCMERQPVFVQ